MTKILAAGGSDYFTQSNPSVECSIYNYSIEFLDMKYSDWLNIGANTGEIKAKEQPAQF